MVDETIYVVHEVDGGTHDRFLCFQALPAATAHAKTVVKEHEAERAFVYAVKNDPSAKAIASVKDGNAELKSVYEPDNLDANISRSRSSYYSWPRTSVPPIGSPRFEMLYRGKINKLRSQEED